MPPKSSAGKEKDLGGDEDVLQAVILADSFNKRFKPLTSGKPRCLLPICNAPLLDWTFESLALAGVQEIFVICRSYAVQVKEAIRNSMWSKPSSGIKIVPIVTAKETFSPGDAMRDIYTHGIITTDFVLVMGDLVSNIRIDEVVREHKERRKTNKDAIMTMVVKESGAKHRTRSRGDASVFVIDSQTSECLHYEPVTGYPPKQSAAIPREILSEHPEVDIRNDLIDCSIDVCSVEVPSLFQDNFDYQDIRRDFVHGVLTSDLLMKNIYCYVAEVGYAARVKDTRSYDAISKDILSRWTFPLVPDDNHPAGHRYEHTRGNKYIAADGTVVLSRTCKVGTNTLIGSSTQVYENAEVYSSTIGQRCVIGPSAVVRHSYIFDDTVIGANAFVDRAIVGAGVKVGEGSRIERGALVADGVVLGKGARLRPFERVSRKRVQEDGHESDDESDEDSELEDIDSDEDNTDILGADSNGIVWPRGPSTEEDEEIDEVENFTNQRLMRIGDTASDLDLSDPGSVTSDEESDSSSSEGSPLARSRSRASSQTSLTSLTAPSTALSSLSLDPEHAAEAEFHREVKASLDRAFAEGHSVDNAAVELKTLRMASNVDIAKVREAVIKQIVEHIKVVDDAAAQRKEISSVVGRWGELINKIGGADPVETVSLLQVRCSASPTRHALFGQLLAALYQADIVEEDDIRAWHKLPASKGQGMEAGERRERMEKCWLVGAKMIHQFDEQETSSEEGESEEEEVEEEEAEEESEDQSEDTEESMVVVSPQGKGKVQPPPSQSTSEEESEEDESEEEESE
ncbi:nucleotide-diphospho-sugar transferase [Punctularia strigosozonata HHB-11173 SS5]|uniref:nucleotide-diphospho-sugar transferase n=1 Tax=Punctularia strigosozonata (strain HHB-11173) TaxID=741275 RepID=UPI0004417194|nr:nucleotide-diphospho-sugar transferase [Punctularia strigosozonata HHB-11173 SS5]EIN07464.1 nucleotide-diphospho-sugar transferase [Punctularia strigosozonata HHB-11173 SS5]